MLANKHLLSYSYYLNFKSIIICEYIIVYSILKFDLNLHLCHYVPIVKFQKHKIKLFISSTEKHS